MVAKSAFFLESEPIFWIIHTFTETKSKKSSDKHAVSGIFPSMPFQGVLGLLLIVGIAWLLSEDRRKVRYWMIPIGILIQLLIALLFLKVPVFRSFFLAFNRVILFLEQSTEAGTSFAFGYLGGDTLPFEESVAGASYVFAFRALPIIIVISAFSALLFYWKILPFLVKNCSKALEKTMGLGGAEGLGVAAGIFLGQVESPLVVRPYLEKMTRSEIFTLMTTGMATIAGTVLVLYASLLTNRIPDIMGHILVASIISLPAAVMISKIMIPETGQKTSGTFTPPEEASSSMDALTQGTVRGVKLFLNVVAMLVVLVALVHLFNLILGLLPSIGGSPVTLQRILGLVLSPVVWAIGIPWNECLTAAELLGTKTILNELFAYIDLSKIPQEALSERSSIIMVYAMCGFANPGSLGIMIGGLGTMVPSRRITIAELGLRSIIAGTMATCMTGAIVGLIL